MTRDPIWDDLKEIKKAKFDADRKRFLQEANASTERGNEWVKHTDFHWSRIVGGFKLDYWPSRKKWQYRGKVHRGLRGMYALIDAKGRE